jgi:hypothetical protein
MEKESPLKPCKLSFEGIGPQPPSPAALSHYEPVYFVSPTGKKMKSTQLKPPPPKAVTPSPSPIPIPPPASWIIFFSNFKYPGSKEEEKEKWNFDQWWC